jgi:hypothetical protein
MFAMLFTLFVAVLAATLWALRSFFLENASPHDPSTLELAIMGVVTLATYRWMKRLQTIGERALPTPEAVLERIAEAPVPTRYADSLAEIRAEEQAKEAEHVA